jgi:hypothetical protein
MRLGNGLVSAVSVANSGHLFTENRELNGLNFLINSVFWINSLYIGICLFKRYLQIMQNSITYVSH